jgi:flagellar biosynthetic protein FliO
MKRWAALGMLLLALAVSLALPARVALADGGEVATATPAPTQWWSQAMADSSQAAPEPSLTETLLSVLWKLALVVLLVYGVSWVMKRLSVRRVVASGQQLQVIETVSLGANRTLHLVRVGSQTLLVGATPQELRTLADVTDTVGSDDDLWHEAAATDEGAGAASSPDGDDGRTLMPSFEAIERVRRLWRRGER